MVGKQIIITLYNLLKTPTINLQQININNNNHQKHMLSKLTGETHLRIRKIRIENRLKNNNWPINWMKLPKIVKSVSPVLISFLPWVVVHLVRCSWPSILRLVVSMHWKRSRRKILSYKNNWNMPSFKPISSNKLIILLLLIYTLLSKLHIICISHLITVQGEILVSILRDKSLSHRIKQDFILLS